MKFYHLTSEKNLGNILKEGLKCHIGENSSLVNEKTKFIYLTEYKYLPYWKILLDRDIILEVNSKDINLENMQTMDYGYYTEFIYDNDIKPEYLKVSNIPISVNDINHAMRVLCAIDIRYINIISTQAAKIYTPSYSSSYSENDISMLRNSLAHYLSYVMCMINRLNYKVLTSGEIYAYLKEYAEKGEYTFCDTYLNTERRLWEQLIHYEENEFSENFKKLHDYIKETFSDVLYIDTGGFCI